MQKQTLLLRLLVCFFFIVMIKNNSNAQTGLNFQGVARSSNNLIIASQQISLRLSILQGSATGSVEYSETRKVTTNAQGLFTAVIGDTGVISTLGSFTTINWKNTPKFLKIEMDATAGNNYTTMGSTQFQYVAYAQYASSVDAENISGIVPITKGGTGVSSMVAIKSILALDKTNNTADTDKPISTKTQIALDVKLNASDTSKYTKYTYADSAFLSKLKIIDTANMLSNRIGKDTLNLSHRINLKANTSDFNNINTILIGKLNASDTIKFTKQIYIDSALLTRFKLIDTIKYTKQIFMDSSMITKLKLSDTASMLSNRIGKDTLILSARINAKANISDVNISLSNKFNITDSAYLLQKSDTTTLSNRINLKANALDIIASLSSKVDKVTGKVLSSNDYTTAEKTKLTAITGTNSGDQDLSTYATNAALSLKENTDNKSTATDLGGVSPSNVLYPTQKAVKDYVTANNASGGISDGSITTIKLDNLAVTDAKVANGISKSKVGLGNVENIALSTWTGTNTITTLGTIATGTWSGTAIAIASGGTGVATTTANTFFAGPNGTTGAPSFRTLVASDLPNISTSYIQNTPDATQTGSIDISGNVKIGTALNVHGIYFGIGKNNQSTNTAIGNTALQGIDDGYNNTAIGNFTMKDNNGGFNNTSVGANAFQNITTGNDNTALGYYAMLNSTTGKFNTATGSYALSSNTGSGNTGSYNVANGYSSMLYNQTGSKNVGVGYYALFANRTGSNNTAIGNQADVASADLTNATAIGNGAIVNASNTIQVGNSSVTSVYTSGAITAPSFNGTLNGNATTATLATNATTAGTASTATKLATPRKINNVDFDGSGGITVTADAGTLTGISLKSTVVGSSLTSVGTIASLTTGAITNSGKIIVGASSAATPSAVLEASSTTQGFLPPRMTRAQRNNIVTPASGLVVWCNNCGALGELQVYSENASWTNLIGTTAAGVYTPTIGEAYQGGKVAYVLVSGDPGYDATTPHGLIAATLDQSTGIKFEYGDYTPTAATSETIGSGLANTNAIIAQATLPNYAALIARTYNGGGYNDWYLPSSRELAKLYLNRNAIGGFYYNTDPYQNATVYWSSSRDTGIYVIAHAFVNDDTSILRGGYNIYNNFRVRAIRSF